VPFCFAAFQRKAKKKNKKLCDLCDSAVKNFIEDPFAVIDFYLRIQVKPFSLTH